jgi:GNAT superfamily N-acetyltransferase
VQFRRALAREAEVLSKIAFTSKAHWPYSPAQLAAWSEDLTVSPSAISGLPTYVVEIERETLGFFVLVPKPEHWRLEHFWISPASTGRGIGRALLKHAVSIAAQRGATALEIDADPNAELFYIACGASRVGVVAAPIEGQPYRERPQMLLSIEQPNPSFKRTRLRRSA